jgi:DNA repair protein RecO (recombination protein O)
MSTIVKSEAVVLRSMKYLESSKIVKFFTPRYGIVGGLVKGARRAKSKFGGNCLEPLSYVSVVFYRKETRELQTVSECSLLRDYRKISGDLGKLAAAMSVLELVAMTASEGEENQAPFRLLVETLGAINDASGNPAVLLCNFEYRSAAHLGFALSAAACLECGRPAGDAGRAPLLHLGKGGYVCTHCSHVAGETMACPPAVLSFLSALDGAKSAEEASRCQVSDDTLAAAGTILWKYLKYHIPSIRPFRSEKVFANLLPLP